jgi:hypothetical protein
VRDGAAARLAAKLGEALAGKARVAVSGAPSYESLLVLPATVGPDPVVVELAPGECVLRFGSGVRFSRTLADPEDEERLVDAVVAITRGNAVERYFFHPEGHVGWTGEIRASRGSARGGDDVEVVGERPLGAW